MAIFSSFSLVWAILGLTANFETFFDIIGTAILIMFGVPVLFFLVVYVAQIFSKWIPNKKSHYISIVCLTSVALFFSISLISSVNEYGWPKPSNYKDHVKITDDGKYEYQLELNRMFWRSSYAQLYLKDTTTEVVQYFRVPINTREIYGLSIGKDTNWVRLELTSEVEKYRVVILNTISPTDEDEYYMLNVNNGELINMGK